LALDTATNRNPALTTVRWPIAPAILFAGALACSGDGGTDPPTLTGVEIDPPSVVLTPSSTAQFTATGRLSDGGTQAVTVSWSATGGTVSASGLYAAGTTDGTYRVVTAVNGTDLADTAVVTILTPPATLVAVEIAPPTAALVPAATQQFSALGRLSNGNTQVIALDWSATGGTVSSNGLYTAGASDGTFRVIAAASGVNLADTATVTITTPPPTIVGIEISPDSARLSYTSTQQFTAVGRLSSGGTTPVDVSWSTTNFPSTPQPNTVSGSGLFRAGAPIGRYLVTATQVGGALSATVPAMVHSTTGLSVSGPTFWRPTAGKVYLCTSMHFTDDGAGRNGTATTTVASGGGVTQPTVNFVNDGVPQVYGDGTGEVKVACQEVWSAPPTLTDTVTVTIAVASTRPGTGLAKVFTYTVPCPVGDCRAGFTNQQSFEPSWNTGTVSEAVVVSPTTGANIWFKSTYVP
jgi:hypothetical protein